MAPSLTCLVPQMAEIIRGCSGISRLQPLYMAGLDFLTGVVLGQFDSLYGSWLPPEQASQETLAKSTTLLNALQQSGSSLSTSFYQSAQVQRARKTQGLNSIRLCFTGEGAIFREELPQGQKFLRDVLSHMCMGNQRGKTSHLLLAQSSVKIRQENKFKNTLCKSLCVYSALRKLWTKLSIKKEKS